MWFSGSVLGRLTGVPKQRPVEVFDAIVPSSNYELLS